MQTTLALVQDEPKAKKVKLTGYVRGGDPTGTYLQTHIDAIYKDLVTILGKPEDGEGYKVSGEWILTDSDGNVVTLYDWKSTSLYDDSYPSVREFRSCTWEQTFNILSCDPVVAETFRHNLALELIKLKQKRQNRRSKK